MAAAEHLSGKNRPSRRPLIIGVPLVLALLAYPFLFASPYQHHLMILVFLHALMAQSWNILAGYCGQISLGHAAFFGLGAYTSGFLFAGYGISPWLGLGCGMLLAAGVALLIGLAIFHLQGHYFAIATLVIGEAIQILFLRWEWVGAAAGVWLPVVRDNPLLNFQFHSSKIPYYYLALLFLLLACLLIRYLDRSRLGFYFRAIREDPAAASSLGVNIAVYKSIAFMLSAAFMALAGAFYAQYVLVIDPETVFSLHTSILVVLMTVLGGVGSLWGPLIGAALLVPLAEMSRIYFGGTGGTIDLMIYGGLIVLLSIYQPAGLVGLGRQLLRRCAASGSRDHDAA